MKTHKITGPQLRGMIKEALEESVVEIQLDEQIAALRAKGGRRSLQETKRYRKLLEMKMEMVDEMGGLAAFAGDSTLKQEQDVLERRKSVIKFIKQKSSVAKRLLQKVEALPAIHDLVNSLKNNTEVGQFILGLLLMISMDETEGENIQLKNVIAKVKAGLPQIEFAMAELEKEQGDAKLEESRRRLIRRR
jgi:hypothetical protein